MTVADMTLAEIGDRIAGKPLLYVFYLLIEKMSRTYTSTRLSSGQGNAPRVFLFSSNVSKEMSLLLAMTERSVSISPPLACLPSRSVSQKLSPVVNSP
jgi:hypothetical protein